MKRRPAPFRDPRQRDGLALATPRRVRLEVDASPWELLSREQRARARRPVEKVTLDWSPWSSDADAQVAVGYRSSPVARERGPELVAALADLGLPPAALRSVDALCWAHVARVRYPDGRCVAFGLSERPRDVAHAESVGFPFARVEGRRVVAWDRVVHGHTAAEVLAAREFVRPRTPRSAAAEGAAS